MKSSDKYTVGEVERICNIPIKTLRYYDSINLITPFYRDEKNGYRYYNKNQMVTICIIRKLRILGFGLKEIHNIIHDNRANILEESIDLKLEEISIQIKNLHEKYKEGYILSQRLKKGVNILSSYSNEDISHTEITIEEIPISYIVFTKKYMKNYSNKDVSLERWIELINLSKKLHLNNEGTIVVTYCSNPLEQFLYKDLNIEFSMYVKYPIDSSNCKTFGGFTAATSIHIGNYCNIMDTHIKMIQYINKNGYKINGNISEEFIISPFDITNPNEHITKIIIPIEKQ